MKKSMQLLGALTLAGVIFSSCQQETIQPGTTEISVNALPEAAIQFISVNYQMAAVRQAYQHHSGSGDDLYEASMSWGMDLYFDDKGGLRGSRDDDNSNDEYLSPNDLPQAILNYVSAEYQATIVEAEKNHHPDGSYSFEIELSNGTELYFDQVGRFIREDDQGGRDSGESSHVSLASLPAGIGTYVQTHFPGQSILKAEKKLNPDGSFRKYEIELSNGTELYFNEAGELLKDDSSSSSSGMDDSIDIPVSELPQKARDYIADHYPGNGISRAKKKLNDDQSVRSYEARLADKTKVFFDAAGNYTGSDD